MEKFRPLGAAIAVAVSGGPDSMALAFCIKRWADSSGHNLRAFIVDHALREASGNEALLTQQRLNKLGIESEILRWQHDAVSSAIQKQARQARYDLLLNACQRFGIQDLFLAHHRDDQAETILMRLAKGSGVEGLVGMKAEQVTQNVRCLRPFLSCSKAQLIATAEATGIDYVRDPSNSSETFARGRLRRVMPLLATEGLTVESLLDLGARAAEQVELLDYATQNFIIAHSQRDLSGAITFALEAFHGHPVVVGRTALARAILHIVPSDYAPRRSELASVFDLLTRDQTQVTRTLGGCLILRRGSRIIVLREPSAVKDKKILHPGECVLWDNRWRITYPSGLDGDMEIKALGSPTHALIDKLYLGLRQQVRGGRFRATMPGLWKGEKLVAIPHGEDARMIRGWA